MKFNMQSILVLLTCIMTSCYPTRIVTVTPGSTGGHTMSSYPSRTTVTYPKTNTVVSVTQNYYNDYDLCLHLDLQAVAAAFIQSSNVRDFEYLLNDPSYMISNLDLDGDGYIDYLRVIEAVSGLEHVFVIQAVLGVNYFQDVATIIVGNPSYASCVVEVIGDPFLYGPKYIIRPIYTGRPPIFAHLCRHAYEPWISPYSWHRYPSYFKPHTPVYITHYQAYVETYMRHHRYCREVMYPTQYHYTNHSHIGGDIHRNDFERQKPERSFATRMADPAGANSALIRAENAKIVNARDLRRVQEAAATRTTTSRTADTPASGINKNTPNQGTSSRREPSTTVNPSSRGTNSASNMTGRGTSNTGANTATRGNSSSTVSSKVKNTGAVSTTKSSGNAQTSRAGSSSSGRPSSSSSSVSSRTGSGSSASPRSGGSSSSSSRTGNSGSATRSTSGNNSTRR